MDKEITFTKRKLRRFIRNVVNSAEKMSAFYIKQGQPEQRVGIEDKAIEYIMLLHTDKIYDGKMNNDKNYKKVYNK